MNILGAMSWGQTLVCLLMIGVCLLLILVVLLQRGRGGGLTGAFGGGGGSAAFGAKTGDVFTWITIVMAGVFILFSAMANFVFDESPAKPGSAVIAAPADGIAATEDVDTAVDGVTAPDGAIDKAIDKLNDAKGAAGILDDVIGSETESAGENAIDKIQDKVLPGSGGSTDKPTGAAETKEPISGEGSGDGNG